MSAKRDLEQRLAFLGLGDADLSLLAGLRPLLERHADALVGAFYRHLLSFAPTRALLVDPAVKERLLGKQREYLLSLGRPQFDEDYLEERRRIGETHDRVGLPPRWYLGAYAHYYSLLAPLVSEQLRADPPRAETTLVALMRVLMLDAQIAMEAYIERQQRELEYLNRELAAAGRDLARDLEKGRAALRQTTHRAEAAEELASVATLVAGLAHEIGTPMGVIQGHAELLESAVSDDKARHRLHTIREQIDRISRIIQALLNVSRPRAPVREPVALQPLIENTLSFLAEKFQRRGVTVERRFEPVATILGDSEKLQQLLLNLFLNAVDAMPQGGTLGVSLAGRAEGGVEIRVADSGTGIPRDHLPRIFEPFYSTKPAGQGSGLGLVVARGIVRDHAGEIDVISEPGVGTEFSILLPGAAPRRPQSSSR